MTKQFYFQRFSFEYRHSLILFDQLRGPYHVLQFRPGLSWELWQQRSTLHSQKLQHYLNLTIRLSCVILGHLLGESYLSAGQSNDLGAFAHNYCILQITSYAHNHTHTPTHTYTITHNHTQSYAHNHTHTPTHTYTIPYIHTHNPTSIGGARGVIVTGYEHGDTSSNPGPLHFT